MYVSVCTRTYGYEKLKPGWNLPLKNVRTFHQKVGRSLYVCDAPVSACCHENNTATRRIILVQTAIEYQDEISVQHMFSPFLFLAYTYEYVCTIQSKKKGAFSTSSLMLD